MTRLHFVEEDTNSMYWAVSGSEDENYEQQFKYVIKDHEFYNNNIYKFTPSSFILVTILTPFLIPKWRK
jgi:hypothetical protein